MGILGLNIYKIVIIFLLFIILKNKIVNIYIYIYIYIYSCELKNINIKILIKNTTYELQAKLHRVLSMTANALKATNGTRFSTNDRNSQLMKLMKYDVCHYLIPQFHRQIKTAQNLTRPKQSLWENYFFIYLYFLNADIKFFF